MDNRLGERIPLQLAIRVVSTRPRTTGIGLLKNLSRSGALIVNCELQLFSLIHVVLESDPGSKQAEEPVAAYVTRVCNDGFGVEWCEFAPPAVAALLQTVIAPTGATEVRQKDSVTAEQPFAEPLLNYASLNYAS
jgi:hypothetical protein